MSSPIYDEQGNVIGTKSGSDTSMLSTAGQIRSMPTIYESNNNINSNELDSYKLSYGGVDNLTYPSVGGNSHFIRFYVNLNEESRLIQNNVMEVIGDANYAEQNRSFQNQTSAEALKAGGTVAGALAGLSMGIDATDKIKGMFKGKLGSGTAAAIGGAAGATIGAGLGFAITDLAIEKFKLTQRLKRLAANITLYTPANIKAKYRFDYEMPEDLIVTLANQENYDAIVSGLKSMGESITSGNFGNALDKAGPIGRILASANQTGSMLSRTAVNHKRDIMFKHVGNRQFDFTYTFAPKTAEEAKVVYDIVFMFKYFAHPEMLQGYGNFLYLYPAEFDIEYGQVFQDSVHGKVEDGNPYLNKISSCVLTDIDVNYSSGNGSYQSLENGEPVITTLSLSFKEIETLHRDRIARGY